MSLYIIGGLIETEQETDELRRALDEIGRQTGVCVAYDIDDDDKEYVATVLGLSSHGLFFRLCDDPKSADITSGWIEAMTAARLLVSDHIADVTTIRTASIASLSLDESYLNAMRHTRLGEAISSIVRGIKAQHGSLSVFDGAPEGDIHLSSDECEKEILKTMVLSWDCLPNLTYVWSSGS